MNAPSIALNDQEPNFCRPARGRVGMFVLIVAEAAIFTIFVVAYLFYIGKSLTGPVSKDVLVVPICNTICLLSLLAFRGRGMGCRFHGRLRDWTMRKGLEDGGRNTWYTRAVVGLD